MNFTNPSPLIGGMRSPQNVMPVDVGGTQNQYQNQYQRNMSPEQWEYVQQVRRTGYDPNMMPQVQQPQQPEQSDPYNDFISNYLIIPVSMLFFYNLVSFKINYFTCLMCQIINCLFILIIVSIFNSIAYSYNLFCPANRFHEFISNFVIFFMQIMLYTIIKHRRFYYEKCCKNHRK